MGKRHKDEGSSKFVNRPFKRLSREMAKAVTVEPAPVRSPCPAPEEPPALSDDDALALAMAGVAPLDGGPALAEKQAKARPMLAEASEEELVMRHLDELVHGAADFDFSDTDEYIEAIQKGVDRRLLRRLRRGEYSFQAHLDLHGLNRSQARGKVGEFIRKSTMEGKKCVLIVHGRGHGSKDNIPVLKTKLAAWLTRGAIGKKVLAYTSAMPYDGGTGAVYVLLRTP
jgi:DNA-nicking Smr family endonuclease